MSDETYHIEKQYREKLEKTGVPEHLHDGLIRYLVHHIQPGHFLTAVLQNDLREACAHGDVASIEGLQSLITFLYNGAPGAAWGSDAAVQRWLSARVAVRS